MAFNELRTLMIQHAMGWWVELSHTNGGTIIYQMSAEAFNHTIAAKHLTYQKFTGITTGFLVAEQHQSIQKLLSLPAYFLTAKTSPLTDLPKDLRLGLKNISHQHSLPQKQSSTSSTALTEQLPDCFHG